MLVFYQGVHFIEKIPNYQKYNNPENVNFCFS